jgi:Zn-dependent protease
VLVEPPRTQYDLNFRLFRFPVRVHPFFWLLAVLTGVGVTAGVEVLLVWVVVVFVSILVHELGHALTFRLFGAGSHIVLYAFGGLAVPWTEVYGRWRRIVVALAGPLAGFALAGIVWGSNQLHPWAAVSRVTLDLALFLIAVNVYWGVLNLLPVYPLDGGQVCHELCSAGLGRRGARLSLQISVGVAAVIAVYSFVCYAARGAPWLAHIPGVLRGDLWTAILFGMLAGLSYQQLQQYRWTDSHWADDDRPPWRR